MLGVDKLTTPTLEFLGIKIRDSVRSYLNSKARERAAVRKFEREFFVRQAELLSYGADQFALGFEKLESELLDRAFVRFEALMKSIAEGKAIEPLRALDIIACGVARKEMSLATAHEVAVYHSAAALLDVLVATYSMQGVFHFCFVPSIIHRQDPAVSDETLDGIMNTPETLEQIQDELEPPDHRLGERIVKSVAEAYGLPPPQDDESG